MAPARKTAAKKTARKTTKKTATRKTAARKAPAKRATKKAPARKAPARKAPARRTAAKKAPAVMTLKHIAADLAEEHEMSKKDAEMFLGDFIDTIGDNLRKGQKIRIAGLGILQVRARPARWGRNPATGEKIRIKASKKVAFRVAKDLKESI